MQLGALAGACNLAARELEMVDGMRVGALLPAVLCRSGVRAKLGVNMVIMAEAVASRLSNERRFGPGPKGSSQKSPR